MRIQRVILLLLLFLGCAFLGRVILRAPQGGSVTLADLDAGAYRGDGNIFSKVASSLADGSASVDANIDLIFYVVLGACAVLLALRVLVSAVRVRRAKRLARDWVRAAQGRSRAREEEVAWDSLAMAEPVESAAAAAPAFESGALDHPPRAGGFSPGELWASLRSFSHGFAAKMLFTFTGVVAIFGLVSVAVVYFTLNASLTAHAVQRARILAVNISAGAPAFLLKKNAAGLRDLLRKFAGTSGVAYALVEDRGGEIFAHSFAVLPQEIQGGDQAAGEATSDQPRAFRLGESVVYEVGVPILEGRAGRVRVALWKEAIDADINSTLVPLIKLIAWVILGGMVLAILFVWRIMHPILRLVRTARRISEGDLDAPALGPGDTTEFGELSRALERMRSSVKAALVRLHHER
jgi:HAMP domain-containing protein